MTSIWNMTKHRYLLCLIIWLCVWFPILYLKISDRPNLEKRTVHVPKVIPSHKPKHANRINYKKMTKICNAPETIATGVEGTIGTPNNSLTLQGVLILIRHGDRGPLTHVRNIASVDCGVTLRSEHLEYTKFLQNLYFNQSLQFLGPFHGYPLFTANNCSISQLTPVGVSQMIKLGQVLRTPYSTLFNISNSDDIIVYSTKYRRTFQSALAFLYSILPTADLLSKVTFRESDSYSYCFEHCACQNAQRLMKKIGLTASKRLKSHRIVVKLLKRMHNIVYTLPNSVPVDPYVLRDSVLTYVCHGAPLPCHRRDCLKLGDVQDLLGFIDWDLKQYSKHSSLRKFGLLKSYGFALNIAMNLLKMVSESKPKLVLYSGHDLTIQHLLLTLGIANHDTISPNYASRLIFEVYKNNTADTTYPGKDYFFRAIFNGKDVTRSVSFCNDDKSQQKRLCPIESAIRFIHDDYFGVFNASNYKQACNMQLP
ncbi:2-phosphoxylose phosphatase 1 [Adelges cooleyi]|uniref:2-phosphoxylose phosphatase 1 n=1 Tax=Adelges cooleyi TaxID=133065 RepID=UPI00217F9100|nr:2-phosphoxylose phosphatase 1 [Adelges cooleyi]